MKVDRLDAIYQFRDIVYRKLPEEIRGEFVKAEYAALEEMQEKGLL